MIPSTFSTYAFPEAAWRARVDTVDLPSSSRTRMRAVLGAARTHRTLVLNGFARADMAALAVLARWPRGPQVVVLDPTWKAGSSAIDRFATRSAVRLLDSPRVHYAVLSEFETRTFPRTWAVAPSRVHAVHWFCTLSDEELAAPRHAGGGVFAGGNSLRDWDLLIDAAPLIPARVTIASSTLTQAQLQRLPPNVTAGPVGSARYDELLRGADVVVVPMQSRTDRSSGQGTMLAAMALGKALVVNDAPGVREYVDDQRSAIVVPLDAPERLAEAVSGLLADHDARRLRGQQAARAVEGRYLRPHYVQRVLDLLTTVEGR